MPEKEATFHSTRWFYQSGEAQTATDAEVVHSAAEVMPTAPSLARMVHNMVGQAGHTAESPLERRIVNDGVWGAVMVANELAHSSLERINGMEWVLEAYETSAYSETDSSLDADIAEVVGKTMDHIYGDDGDLATASFAYGLNLIQYFAQKAQEYEPVLA